MRLCERFRDLILGRPLPPDSMAATFADAVASMVVLDAIRESVAEHRWVTV